MFRIKTFMVSSNGSSLIRIGPRRARSFQACFLQINAVFRDFSVEERLDYGLICHPEHVDEGGGAQAMKLVQGILAVQSSQMNPFPDSRNLAEVIGPLLIDMEQGDQRFGSFQCRLADRRNKARVAYLEAASGFFEGACGPASPSL